MSPRAFEIVPGVVVAFLALAIAASAGIGIGASQVGDVPAGPVGHGGPFGQSAQHLASLEPPHQDNLAGELRRSADTFTRTPVIVGSPVPERSSYSVSPLVSPVLTVSPVAGFVGTPLTFNGTGFAANSGVIVSWSQGTACSTTTNAEGNFSCALILPASSAGGHTFTGSDSSSHSATATFTVIPQLIAMPATGTVGTTVTFAGTGFAGGSGYACTCVTLSWKSGSVQICFVPLSTLGSFSCTYTIPTTAGGPHSFTGTDDSGQENSAMTTFTVDAGLTVSPVSGTVGTVITFDGTGYVGSSTVSVSWAEGFACSSTATTGGDFNCTFTLPATTAGSHLFTGTDTSSDSAAASFAVTPRLIITPPTGPVGTSVQLSGTGFGGDMAVTVDWNGGSETSFQMACTATASVAGNFTCPFVITATDHAGYTFTATDASSDTATTTFTVVPKLVANPSTGGVGTLVTFYGTGYGYKSSITATWGQGNACTSATTAVGNFSCGFKIPSGTVGGSYAFTATDSGSNTATTTFLVGPVLTMTPSSGTVGDTVMFSATGFAGLSTITVSWANGPVCSGTTTAGGSFSCEFTVPQTTVGLATFTATDAESDSEGATFSVGPQLTTTPVTGPVGTPVTYTGTGYAASSAVTVSWAAGVACTTTSNALGSFSCKFTIPAATVGAHTFTGADASSDTATTLFAVTATLKADAWTPAAPVLDLGESVTLTANPSGGVLPYQIQWFSGSSSTCLNDTMISGATESTYVAIPTVATFYCYQVADNESPSGVELSGTGVVAVNPTLTAGPVSPAAPTIDSGEEVTLTANPSGGTGPDGFQWYAGLSPICSADAAVPEETAATLTVAPLASTYYCYTVRDSASPPASVTSGGGGLVMVNPVLEAGTVSPTSARIDAGQSLTLSANPRGGTQSYGYQWYAGPSPTCSSDSAVSGATSATYTVSPSTDTYYCYTVTDSAELPASEVGGPREVTVNSALAAGSPLSSASAIASGQTVTLTANPSGGTEPYAYQWYAGPSATCAGDSTLLGTGETMNVSPTTNTYYCYKATDSSAGSPAASVVSGTDLVEVKAPSSGSGFLGTGIEGYALFGGLLAWGLAGTAVAIWYSRRGHRIAELKSAGPQRPSEPPGTT